MAKNKWKETLKRLKAKERPEAVLLMAGQAELARIAVAWMQTKFSQPRRLTKLTGASDEAAWTWLWENVRYDKAQLLARIPNANARTQKNIDALIANRVLYPDGTVHPLVERYLGEMVLKLFASAQRKQRQLKRCG